MLLLRSLPQYWIFMQRYLQFFILDFHPPPPPPTPFNTDITPRNTFLEKPVVPQLVQNSQHFTEPEGSLPSSQKPATSTYPEPKQSSPHIHTLHTISWKSTSLLSYHTRLGLPNVHPDNGGGAPCLPYKTPFQIEWAIMPETCQNIERSAHCEGPSSLQPCTSVNAPRSKRFTLSYLASVLQWFLPVVKRLHVRMFSSPWAFSVLPFTVCRQNVWQYVFCPNSVQCKRRSHFHYLLVVCSSVRDRRGLTC